MTDNAARLDGGRFWLPNDPDEHVGGWLDATSCWPLPADDDIDSDAFTVHGHLRRGPRRIMLTNATSAGRSMVFGGRGRGSG